MVEVEHRANELYQLLVKHFGHGAQLQSRFVSREKPGDSPDIATWMQREGERFYLYRGFPNGEKVELAVTELALERFGVLAVLRAVEASNALVALEGHRTLIYVDDELLRYRPVASVH